MTTLDEGNPEATSNRKSHRHLSRLRSLLQQFYFITRPQKPLQHPLSTSQSTAQSTSQPGRLIILVHCNLGMTASIVVSFALICGTFLQLFSFRLQTSQSNTALKRFDFCIKMSSILYQPVTGKMNKATNILVATTGKLVPNILN